MISNPHLKSELLQHGPTGYRTTLIKFTPGTPPTVSECHGFTGVTRSNTGIYVAALSQSAIRALDITVEQLKGVPGDTNYHTYDYAINQSAGTITVTHKTCAYSAIASAPAASDTSGEITLIAKIRTAE